MFERTGRALGRRPTAALAAVLAVAAVLALGLPKLRFETSQDSLIGAKSPTGQANRAYQSQFGGEPMYVLYTGDIEQLFTADNIARQQGLENRLRAQPHVAAVLDPLTALNFAQAQLAVGPAMLQSAKERNPQNADAFNRILATEAGRLVKAGPQKLTNPAFVRYLLYDDHGQIRSILRDNFIDATHALTVVRLDGNLPIASMGPASDAIRQTVAAQPLAGFKSLATGPPPLLKDINDYLQGGMAKLGGLAVGVMVAVLFLVWRRRWRLLSLAVVAVGAVASFGIMGFIGLPLNLVTISGFPILVGMGVDFAVQMHSRFEEELDHGAPYGDALGHTMAKLAPALALAMVAAVVGFIGLQVSQVPMIRQFGVMLDIGVAALFVVVLVLPPAAMVLRERRKPTAPGSISTGGLLERGIRRTTTLGRGWALAPMAIVAVLVIVAGLAVEGRFTIQTDPERWVNQKGQTVHDLQTLRTGTRSSTELDFLVEAPDVTSTAVAGWLQSWAQDEVRKHPQQLLRFMSMGAVVTSVTGALPGQPEMTALLGAAPGDVRRSFVSADHRRASIIFPIANISLAARGQLLRQMEADLKPPAGVSARPAGLAVVGVALTDALESNRLTMTFAALGLVVLLLLLAYRSLTRTVLTLVPVLLAVGASSLVVYLSGLELSPLTSVSGPLVIAVCTEFAILITSRYVEERGRGLAPEDALAVGVVRIGRAFVASGLTLIGGFGALALSAFPLLREFGIIVALNAVVALVSALVLLPPVLVWADRHIAGFSPGRTEAPDQHLSRPLHHAA